MKKATRQLIVLITITILNCSYAQENENAQKLHQIFEQAWQYQLSRSPILALNLGTTQSINHLADISETAYKQESRTLKGFLDRLSHIDFNSLEFEDQISYLMFKQQIENINSDIMYAEYEIPITSESSFHTSLSRTHTRLPFTTANHYEDYIQILKQIPQIMTAYQNNMRSGLARGFSQPQIVLKHYPEQIRQYIVKNPHDSEYYQPFKHFPDHISEAMRQNFSNHASEVIRDHIIPAYKKFHDFMQNEYIPKARTNIAATSLPNGKDYYKQQIREYTTLNLTPEEINKIGWQEVKRIRREMKNVIKKTGFKGEFKEFIHHLKTDKRFYAKTPEKLLKEARNIAKKMDGLLPQLFGRLPRQPYAVNPVPENIAKYYTAGRYIQAPINSNRPGQYWVNTYGLDKRPLYNLEALTLHEAVPGHHLQIALAQELTHLPAFRRHNYISAHGEGWGLYSERLGKEVGLYQDPYSDFGRLTYEMWRAMRLVIDTGIHAMGMTRDEAIQLMQENTALSDHNIKTEIDRYISWPGQALSYKLGEIKIRELRKKAEKELGNQFDIRSFHDTIIGSGSVSLTALDKIVERYIKSHKDK